MTNEEKLILQIWQNNIDGSCRVEYHDRKNGFRMEKKNLKILLKRLIEHLKSLNDK